MEKIRLDLRFRVIPEDRNVFIAFPGAGYTLYEAFVATRRIFPELPGLALVSGKPLSEQPDDLDQRIMRARAIDRWYSSGKRSDPPKRRLADYHPDKRTRWLPNARGVVSGYFEKMRRGDLVIIPPHTIFANTLIGELQDEPWQFENIKVPALWEDEPVPSRSVKWLATVAKGELSLALQKRFPSPNAVRLLDREARAEVYALAYGSYTIEDSFTVQFDVTSSDFSTVDDYYLQQFFNVVAALTQELETKPAKKGEAEQHVAASLDEIIELLTDSAYVPNLTININSPGSVALSCAKIVPLVAAGLLALTLLNPADTWKAAAEGKLEIVNTQAPQNDQCTARVAAEVLAQLNIMGYARWQQMCKRAQQVKKDTGLTSNSNAEKK